MPKDQHLILFYKYHPLSSDKEKTAVYRDALETLCVSLGLSGRILVGYSESEGINGTLSGDYPNVRAFTYALLGNIQEEHDELEENAHQSLEQFWVSSQQFFESIGKPVLKMSAAEDFKWSRADPGVDLFPDLNIKLVPELIGSGGKMASIPLEETAQGYLTPEEWHAEMKRIATINNANNDGTGQRDTVLIDCRNTKECQIGHFENAIDPNTTTFAQFSKWVDDHRHFLADKKVLMYCTGGIRCEKASAYVRRQVPNSKGVHHLKGGIHKYLESEAAADGSFWKGRNFVFDGRGGASAEETQLGKDGGLSSANTNATIDNHDNKNSGAGDIVGQCIYCRSPYDSFDAHCVCTVCREPTLVCSECQKQKAEYHCRQHFHLRSCYFTNLESFSRYDLCRQLEELESMIVVIAVGRRYKQKRKTLYKQCEKIRQQLSEVDGAGVHRPRIESSAPRCRNCNDSNCSGKCWGFYSLKRKQLLEEKKEHDNGGSDTMDDNTGSKRRATSSLKRNNGLKQLNRDRASDELLQLGMSLPPSAHRDTATGIRVPPPCTRLLQTRMKGKWNGRPVLDVVKEEFSEMAKPGVIEKVLEIGLLRVNGVPVTLENAGVGLKTGDTVSRVVHWHEPPILVPVTISVQIVELPRKVMVDNSIAEDADDAALYVCNKPSSVPVHPAGPYMANSLTVMVEAQESLPPQSLLPCHRTDRVTSGLTICCTNPLVAKLVQRSIFEHQVQKLYLARVGGHFPASNTGLALVKVHDSIKSCSTWKWHEQAGCVEVRAPIETVDPSKGLRQVTAQGKPSTSRFRLLSHDPSNNLSVISCCPVTGRSHQLRVHLQMLGFPIFNDVLYGGSTMAEKEATGGVDTIDLLLKSTRTTGSKSKHRGSSISEEDVAKAQSACPLCVGGGYEDATSFFTPAQLLQEGHCIDLHAYWYRINILPKKMQKNGTSEPGKILDLKVEHPSWLDPSLLSEITWFDK